MTRLLGAGTILPFLLVAVGSAATQRSPTVSLASPPPALVAGRAWNAVLVVRGARPARISVSAVAGRRRVSNSARRWRGSRYRVRLVLPAAGRWTLSARLGRSRFRLGRVTVRAAPRPPLLLNFPIEAALDPTGALLLVENGAGRVLRIDPASGRSATLAPLPRPFGVARAPSGDLYVSEANTVRRIDPARRVTTVAQADSDVGPVAIDAAGNVYFTTRTRIFRIEGGTGPVTHYAGTGVEGDGGDGGHALQAEFRQPHGLAIGADGALYVADTDNNRIRRIDPATRVITAFAAMRIPSGLGVGPDGALYVAQPENHRVLRVDRTGNTTVAAGSGVRGSSGDRGSATAARLDVPVDVAVTTNGTLFIVQTGAAGRVRRVDPSGRIETILRR